jgi:hypothetical protein
VIRYVSGVLRYRSERDWMNLNRDWLGNIFDVFISKIECVYAKMGAFNGLDSSFFAEDGHDQFKILAS